MKLPTATAAAVFVVASLSLGGLAPAFAQSSDAPAVTSTQKSAASTDRNDGAKRHWGHRAGSARSAAPGGGMLDLTCGPSAGEQLELGLVRLKYRVQPTAEQAPLFDALQQTAIASQKSFADTCKTAMPDRTAATRPNLVDRMETRLAVDTARVSALTDIVPKFRAFYDSLTDTQKAQLDTRQNRRGARMNQKDGNHWRAGQLRDHTRGMGNQRWNRPANSGSATPAAPADTNNAPTDAPAT